jgi:hypothetical protein
MPIQRSIVEREKLMMLDGIARATILAAILTALTADATAAHTIYYGRWSITFYTQ